MSENLDNFDEKMSKRIFGGKNVFIPKFKIKIDVICDNEVCWFWGKALKEYIEVAKDEVGSHLKDVSIDIYNQYKEVIGNINQ